MSCSNCHFATLCDKTPFVKNPVWDFSIQPRKSTLISEVTCERPSKFKKRPLIPGIPWRFSRLSLTLQERFCLHQTTSLTSKRRGYWLCKNYFFLHHFVDWECRERANRALVIVLTSKQCFRLRNDFRSSVSRRQVLAERIWDEILFLFFVYCGYKQYVVPWVVTVLRHQRLGIDLLAVFRDATWNSSGNIILTSVNSLPPERLQLQAKIFCGCVGFALGVFES